MLTNIYEQMPAAIPGTRIVEWDYGVLGARITDPQDARRTWEVQGLYLPIQGRALGGLRAKLMDQRGFITFCNQRDLEVLLGIGRVGQPVEWRDDEYCSPDSREWCGLCCDEDDLEDDLQEQEMFIRGSVPGGILIPNMELTRRVHLHHGYDCEELYLVVQDYDPETGVFPDTRFDTIQRRWSRAERRRVRWDR